MTGGIVRIIHPNWQGGAFSGYHLGGRLLELLFPLPADQHQLIVDVAQPSSYSPGLAPLKTDRGITDRSALVKLLGEVTKSLEERAPDRIVTIGGDCAASIAPFAYLASKYGDDMAVVWIDAHPDLWTTAGNQHLNAMALAVLTGTEDANAKGVLPATIKHSSVWWVGLRAELDESIPHIGTALRQSTSANELNCSISPALAGIARTGASKLAIHFDVDSLDPSEFRGVAVPEKNGITLQTLQNLLNSIAAEYEIVGFTVAEHIPNELIQLRSALSVMPML